MRIPNLGLPPYQSFTLEELEEATNHFDQINLIAEGSQGQVHCLKIVQIASKYENSMII